MKSFAVAVPPLQPADSCLDLFGNTAAWPGGRGKSTTGTETRVVAEDAPAPGHRAVDVRAGEPRVDTHTLHAATELVLKKKLVREVPQPGRSPAAGARTQRSGDEYVDDNGVLYYI